MHLYVVGVRRRLLPFLFKRFVVVGHQMEGSQLYLDLADGSSLILPRMDRRVVKLYSGWRQPQHRPAPPPPVNLPSGHEPAPVPDVADDLIRQFKAAHPHMR